MTWQEKTVIRILMLVAQFIAPSEWSADIKQLSTHLSVNTPVTK